MDRILRTYLLLIAMLMVPTTVFADLSFNPITGKLDKVGATTTDYNAICTISTQYTNTITINDHERSVLIHESTGDVLTC